MSINDPKKDIIHVPNIPMLVSIIYLIYKLINNLLFIN